MAILLALLPVCVAFLLPAGTQAREASESQTRQGNDFHGYVRTVYNGENGLPGGRVSDLVQTKDGVLWIGTYGGLYRYSGTSFQWMNQFESVKNVNCLYTDEAGRLWIGTNDNGLSICIGQEISNVVNQRNGLPSNSVRCITQDTEGYYYVGTADSLVIMTLSGGFKVCGAMPEIARADSVAADQNGNAAAVTEEGDLYLLRGTEILARQTLPKEGETYKCCAYDETGKLYVGTSAGAIWVYRISEGQLKEEHMTQCGDFGQIHSLRFSEEGVLFVCAENGAGYLSPEGTFCPLNTAPFNRFVEHMLTDYQGNLWFTSSRLGLLRLCPSVFQEVYGEEGMSGTAVNTVIKWQDCLYMGTESGLAAGSKSPTPRVTDSLIQKLQGTEIYCMTVDSHNHLWICASGRGIFEISEEGEIENYDRKAGTLGDTFRCAIELKEGGIAAAGDQGVTFLREGKVCDTVGDADGLSNPKVLSLWEREDGSILAGTDGSGIAVIRDAAVTGYLTREDGLSSDVILRMVSDSEGGLFIVTGNGLCYADSGNNIRALDNFPYYNNYDIAEGIQGELFVLSSAGIYVVDKAELLRGEQVQYELLNYRQGLRINLTPNAWNYIDEGDHLYLSGDTGVVSINLSQHDIAVRSYRMLLTEIKVDGEVYSVEKGEPTHIPRGADRIEIVPEVVNYSLNDPAVSVYLQGIDKEPKILPQSELASVVYTNLPSGDYTFHLAVLDGGTGRVIAENTYRIVKEKEIYDNWWFKLYAGIEACVIVSYLTWMFVRTQIQKTFRIQKMELEWAKSQLRLGNETILTIAQAVDAKDEKTSRHSVRVSEYSVLIARRLGFDEEECENLRKIAMLHDIGKIGIPDQVLNKPGRLTDEEYEMMKSHVTRGAEILKNFTLIEHVADGALYHHERYDGKGYVHGLKGEEIPLNARIIGIADAFDAMTSNRVYRGKQELAYVLEELKKGSGTQFDPGLVEIMLGLMEDGSIDVGKIYRPESCGGDKNED